MACLYLDGYLLLQAILYFAIFAAGLASSIASGLAKVRRNVYYTLIYIISVSPWDTVDS